MASGAALLVKRVVGLPGERLSIADGIVFVNDIPLDEPYVTFRRPWQVHEVTIAADEIYVIGDNRGMPARSHDFGRASLTRVAGRILGR
jgi:signal peptidase I